MYQSKNIKNYLESAKKMSQSDRKKSLSRNASQQSLTNSKESPMRMRGQQQNAEESNNKKTRRYQDQDDNLIDTRDYKFPLRKVKSIQSSSELYGSRNLTRRARQDSEEEEEEKAQSYNNKMRTDNFQESRKQAKLFIESLARRINIEIESINYTVDEFNKNFRRTVDTEYAKLRTKIMNTVEEMFESQQDYIKNMSKTQIRNVNQQLSDVRAELEKMYGKLQKTKQGLEGTNWRKVTGQILTGEIETNVMELIKKSEKMKILKNVKMISDVKKQEAFLNVLEDLLQVNLVSGIDPNNPIKITAF